MKSEFINTIGNFINLLLLRVKKDMTSYVLRLSISFISFCVASLIFVLVYKDSNIKKFFIYFFLFDFIRGISERGTEIFFSRKQKLDVKYLDVVYLVFMSVFLIILGVIYKIVL